MRNTVKLIGREKEISLLNDALRSEEAEMIAVIGRRRVGKTFLIRQTYRKELVFEFTGLQNGPRAEQLQAFAGRLNTYLKTPVKIQPPENWLAAFQLLIEYLETKISEEKIVVFLDELPWMATHRSGFMRAFEYFWNSWASQQNIVVVVCGSAASWMIKRVVRNRGGLYNRITRRIFLQPFTLYECEQYLNSRQVRMDRYQIIQIYMAMGGIPHYLKEIERGKSAVQNIDRICFASEGLLYDEFSALYAALFEGYERHVLTVRALAGVRQGLSRTELIRATGLSDGGGFTRMLEELLRSGFIGVYPVFGKTRREQRYRLIDEYSLFYLKFIEPENRKGEGTWQRLSQTQTWISWSGYAFEGICLKHIYSIRRTLSIGGVYSEASTFFHRGNEQIPGFQIDLLLDRNDHTINIFEIKFYRENPIIDKKLAEQLRRKVALFRAATSTKKQLFLTLLTTFPVIENSYSGSILDQSLDMNALFQPDEHTIL